ncbi:hypothetical protein CgunFtcFv8_009725 [Champsocephalus gunnari]|uniref:Uncharacterized protein n=1 Tax=Champsocephalus gunnari TaxID=52237 RepID=A0AAN8GXZ5_CHAGU|nr:hypothetical protein CgunFtcFv8_009725 [Champsocephalus gunnari]
MRKQEPNRQAARARTAAADKAIHACQNPAARPVIYEDPQSRLPSKSSIQQPFVHSRHPSTLHPLTHLALTMPLRHAHVLYLLRNKALALDLV